MTSRLSLNSHQTQDGVSVGRREVPFDNTTGKVIGQYLHRRIVAIGIETYLRRHRVGAFDAQGDVPYIFYARYTVVVRHLPHEERIGFAVHDEVKGIV